MILRFHRTVIILPPTPHASSHVVSQPVDGLKKKFSTAMHMVADEILPVRVAVFSVEETLGLLMEWCHQWQFISLEHIVRLLLFIAYSLHFEARSDQMDYARLLVNK